MHRGKGRVVRTVVHLEGEAVGTEAVGSRLVAQDRIGPKIQWAAQIGRALDQRTLGRQRQDLIGQRFPGLRAGASEREDEVGGGILNGRNRVGPSQAVGRRPVVHRLNPDRHRRISSRVHRTVVDPEGERIGSVGNHVVVIPIV